jgi:hypothetical protein
LTYTKQQWTIKISSPLFPIFSLADHRIQFWKGAIQGIFHQSLVAIGPVVSEEKFLCEFPIGSYAKLSSDVGAILVEGPNRLTNFERDPSNDYFINI